MKKVTSLLFEIVRVLVRFDHVASFIVNADHSTMCDCTMIAGRNRSFLLIRKFVISCSKENRNGNHSSRAFDQRPGGEGVRGAFFGRSNRNVVGQTAIQTDRGLVLEHNPGPEHGVVKLRVIELVPNKRVEWECISFHPKSSPASAWTGTHFVFELSERTDSSPAGRDQVRMTTVDFQQVGYDERSEYFESNKTAWGEVLQNLKRVVESPRS